jgi:hypothetical protein
MRGLFAVGVLMASAAAAGAGEVTFERLPFGGEAEYGIFSVDVDGDGSRDLIALGRGRISVYRRHPTAEPQYPAEPEVLTTASLAYFADVADVLPAPGQELLILTPTGIDCFYQEGGRYVPRARKLIECETLLTSRPLRGAVGRAALRFNIEVLPWNFAFDTDGDGRDDVLVPHGGGTDVYLQTKEPGQFAKPITLPIFPFVFHSLPLDPKVGDLAGTKASRIRLTLELLSIERRDVNGDQKPDLVCGRQWFAQRIDPTPDQTLFDTVPAEVPFDLPGEVDPNLVEIRADINKDGHPDRILADTQLIEPLHLVTHVRYFLADADGNVPPTPTGTVRGQNILIHTPLPVHDFNGDGLLDFAMFDTDIQLTEVAKWIRTSFGQIDGDLNFWFFDKAANGYAQRRSYRKALSLRFKVDLMDAMANLVWDRYVGTMMRFEGDYNADRRLDLLVREKTETIALYFNTGDARDLYPSRPSLVLEGVPAFGGLAVEDLNADGASDLILYRGSSAFAPSPNPNDVIAIYVSRLR